MNSDPKSVENKGIANISAKEKISELKEQKVPQKKNYL